MSLVQHAFGARSKPRLPLDVYKCARAYIEHEDQLVTDRTRWFLTINGFLVATLGVILPKMIDESVKFNSIPPKFAPVMELFMTDRSYTSNYGAVSLYYFFVLCLCFVGIRISHICRAALEGAYSANAAIKEILNRNFSNGHVQIHIENNDKSCEIYLSANGRDTFELPALTRGGIPVAEEKSLLIRFGLVDLMEKLWMCFGAIDLLIYGLLVWTRYRT